MSRLEEETSPIGPARTDTPLGGRAGAGARSERDEQDDALKRSTIMMVDDEPTTLEVLEAFLQGEGYENFVATSDSTEALELLRREKPDVLLSDLMMPSRWTRASCCSRSQASSSSAGTVGSALGATSAGFRMGAPIVDDVSAGGSLAGNESSDATSTSSSRCASSGG